MPPSAGTRGLEPSPTIGVVAVAGVPAAGVRPEWRPAPRASAAAVSIAEPVPVPVAVGEVEGLAAGTAAALSKLGKVESGLAIVGIVVAAWMGLRVDARDEMQTLELNEMRTGSGWT